MYPMTNQVFIFYQLASESAKAKVSPKAAMPIDTTFFDSKSFSTKLLNRNLASH
jgi:hypothetical protein